MLGKHLLGIYEKALDAEDDWYQRMAKVKELGFDFMEISIDETDERCPVSMPVTKKSIWIQDAAHKARGVYPVPVPERASSFSVWKRGSGYPRKGCGGYGESVGFCG